MSAAPTSSRIPAATRRRSLLGLLPLLEQGLVAPGATISVNAASGVTGAGFTPRRDLLFGEVTENFRAYGAGEHAPAPGRDARGARDARRRRGPRVHAAPASRRARDPRDDHRAADARAARMRSRRGASATRTSRSSRSRASRRRCATSRTGTWCADRARPVAHVRTPTLLVLSAIDNLMKGAAGQAMQNANLMLGLDETMGLPRERADARREDRRTRAG